MNLRNYEGKNVKLIDNDGEIFEGYVSESVTYSFDEQGEAICRDVFVRVFHLDSGRMYFIVQYM